MNFEKKDNAKNFGLVAGFILFYFVFTTVLFFILKLTHKLPENWSYINIMIITLLIVIVGKTLEATLK